MTMEVAGSGRAITMEVAGSSPAMTMGVAGSGPAITMEVQPLIHVEHLLRGGRQTDPLSFCGQPLLCCWHVS